MKILSLLVFSVAMAWTWIVVHRMDSIPYSSHEGLQAEIGQIIQDAVRKTRPTAQQLVIEKVWTENLDKDRVRAEYTYSFVDGEAIAAAQTITGELFLKRIQQDGAQEVWELEKVQTTNETLTFAEGIVVRPTSAGGEADEEELTPEEEAPATEEVGTVPEDRATEAPEAVPAEASETTEVLRPENEPAVEGTDE